MSSTALKVGELAKRTGVSVRALHHYDEIGLLSPRHRTEAGYRVYGPGDIVRLLQIKSLQQLGFSLEEIRNCLDRPGFSLSGVIELHLERLREEIDLQRKLVHRLESIAERLRAAEDISAKEFIETVREVTMFDKYYTAEQMEQLKERRHTVGEERIHQVEVEWKELFAQFRAEKEKGADPASPAVQALVRKSRSLIEEFTGGDAGIEKSLSRMYREEGAQNVLGQHGFQLDPGVSEYMAQARKAAQEKE